MKKFQNISFLIVLTAAFFSCEKHTIEYDTVAPTGKAEFQLHYFVPVTASSANNIYQVEINGEVYSSAASPLSTYNAIPSGGVGRFYNTKVGTNNIKLYMGEGLTLVYDQNCELQEGKQNIFVYDFDKPPIVINNGYPYTPEVTEHTGTTAWIKFYNFLFESGNTPTPLKIQYQYQYTTDNATGAKSDWMNVGDPVAFGEATDWVPVHVNKTVEISSGSARLDYRAFVVNPDGSLGDPLKVMNSGGNMVNYSDWWTAYVGRRYHHILGGMRTAKPVSSVRQFTAL